MEKTKYPSAIMDRANIRLPEGLRDRLHEAAKINNRSMNAELVVRLEESFQTQKQIAPAIIQFLEQHIDAEVSARLKAIAAKIGGAA